MSRWVDDPVEDARGFFVYLRDVDSNEVWSAGLLPTLVEPSRYSVMTGEGRHRIEREDHGIALSMDTAVSAEEDVEARRMALRNESSRCRTIELTSNVEVALAHPMGDLGHPAFSKLFVQTERVGSVLMARRRPRSQGESWPVMYHALIGGETQQWETDRLRFIGRGRGLAHPKAMLVGERLSGTVGNVLDPMLSLRTTVRLEPGASVELHWVLGAAADGATATKVVNQLSEGEALSKLFAPVAMTKVEQPRRGPKRKPMDLKHGASPSSGTLEHFNGIGGFSADGAEYVMRLKWAKGALELPPMPWINVLANEAFGCLVSETGAGCTWSRNSQANRLTPWSNDPVTDPHDECLYLRDEATGQFWSPMPGPAPAPVEYEARHGRGWSRFVCEVEDVEQEVTVFVARHEPVKVVRLRLENRGQHLRKLSLFSYKRLGPGPFRTWRQDEVLYAEKLEAGDFAGATVFSLLAASGDIIDQRVSCDRQGFLGSLGSVRAPQALFEPILDDVCGDKLDACFAQQVRIELKPGETFCCCFVLGEAMNAQQLQALCEKFSSLSTIERELAEVDAFWRETLAGVQVQTPVPEIDLMVNGWLSYQTLVCRIWGRSAFYQSSGAFGFRDQLQDAGNVLMLWPEIARSQILLHARHQFEEGDVLHWWHDAPVERGVRTRFADDLLWLPLTVLRYVSSTGDASLLDEVVPFLHAEELKPGQEENYFKPEASALTATVYEHCRRAVLRSLTTGAHGLPLMGTGDWNDGMNRVGREGRGESVWMGFFLYQILGQFIPVAEMRGDHEVVQRCGTYRQALRAALDSTGWDGEWYRRAYFDDGTPLGTAGASECQIDGLAQAWAVLSGVALPERASKAMKAVEERLIVGAPGLIKLLTPPFVNTLEDPGYIKGYVAGVRENGGQYTHAACWVVMAFAAMKRRDKAASLLKLLSPVWHSRNAEEVERYKVEPYVIAADVYGAEPHVGRGGWTWYTGSAGWAWRVAVESVLGLRIEGGDTLIIEPCVPDNWPRYLMTYRAPGSGTVYEIEIMTDTQCMETPKKAILDGAELMIAEGMVRVPVAADGSVHRVIVTMGSV